ncbi:hypothetical protein Tco_0556398 [Tanacetum coccineum]
MNTTQIPDAKKLLTDLLDSLSLSPQSQENIPQAAETVTTSNDLDLLFSLMFDELLNGTSIVSKSFAENAANALDKRQQQNTTPSTTTIVVDTPLLIIQTTPETTNQALTQAPTVTATENIMWKLEGGLNSLHVCFTV